MHTPYALPPQHHLHMTLTFTLHTQPFAATYVGPFALLPRSPLRFPRRPPSLHPSFFSTAFSQSSGRNLSTSPACPAATAPQPPGHSSTTPPRGAATRPSSSGNSPRGLGSAAAGAGARRRGMTRVAQTPTWRSSRRFGPSTRTLRPVAYSSREKATVASMFRSSPLASSPKTVRVALSSASPWVTVASDGA